MKFSLWLIIGSVVIVSLTGCSTSVTKRRLPSLAQFEKKQESISISPTALKEENDFLTDSAAREIEIPKARRLPTLREQMQKIAEEQAAINTSHTALSEDVLLVRQDMAQMKQSLEDIKDVLEEMRGAKPAVITRGEESGAPQSRVLKSEAVSEEILPDDVARETYGDDVIEPDNEMELPKKTPPVKKKKFKEKNFKATEEAGEKKPVTIREKPVTEPLFETAIALFKKKNYSETITLLDGVLKTEKSPAVKNNCYYWLGESYFGLGQYSQAIGFFKKVAAFKNSEKSDDAQRMIAEAYAKGGNVSEARRAFQKLIDINPDSELVPLARKRLQTL